MKRLAKLILGDKRAKRFSPHQLQALGLGTMVSIWDRMTEEFELPLGPNGKPDVAGIPDPANYIRSKRQLEDMTDNPDMAGHLNRAELAEAEDAEGGYRIRGTVGRIEWLAITRANGGKGGRPPGNRNRTGSKPEVNPPVNRNRTGWVTGSKPEVNHTIPILDPDLDLVPAQEQEQDPEGGRAHVGGDGLLEPDPTRWRRMVARWAELYAERTGSPPSETEPPREDMTRRFAVRLRTPTVGEDGVIVRMERLFRNPPPHLRASVPTWLTLDRFFDALVDDARPTEQKFGAEAWNEAAKRLEREGR